MNVLASYFLKGMIIIYQKLISRFFLPNCRYVPTCSQYGLEAITKFGPWRGMTLTIKRIISCHPWGGEGHDPVP